MIDMTRTIAPKSDQLNADDLIGGPRTIQVTRVSILSEAEQPIAINFEGDNGKPYKPCKSMRRVMVHLWGGDGSVYPGRRMTLFCDPKVMFGGVAVGGIRISHMSDIDRETTMALTDKKASRKPYTVKVLAKVDQPAPQQAQQQAGPQVDPAEVERLRGLGEEAAARGMGALGAFWNGRNPAEKAALGGKPTLNAWKVRAGEADAASLDDSFPGDDRVPA